MSMLFSFLYNEDDNLCIAPSVYVKHEKYMKL